MINSGRETEFSTAAAMGTAVRAVGQGLKVVVYRFYCEDYPAGQKELMGRVGVQFRFVGEVPLDDAAATGQVWEEVRQTLATLERGLVILDGVVPWFREAQVDALAAMQDIERRPPRLHVILTGPDPQPSLALAADTITEMRQRYNWGRSMR
ncbi:MAG: cob(I)yrinic acid a,c-diamide adenosyltransferase [Deltaproteobacteria bacterium]|nr:cob(I)yrinic acid a,c-diamide adenosyltransferase [Deltaproteobacteria bacterium]